MSDRVSPESIELAARLRPAILRLNRQLRRETMTLGVSPLMVLVLSAIRKDPGIGVSELAALENMRVATMSNHIKQLEESGLVRRDSDSHADKRRVQLAITPKAQTLIEEVRKARTDWLAKRVASLPAESRDALENAVEALTLLAE